MKVNKVYRIVRPMRQFGRLLKDMFYSKESTHFWVRVAESTKTKEEKENHIFKIVELLNERIKIKL